MKYQVFGVVAVFLLFGVSQGQNRPERDMKGGVEVIVNHLKPYAIKDQPVELHLEELFSINTADASMLPIGLIEMYTFDVDSKGDIFAIRWRASENYVFKFDSQGRFVKSFVRRGQGPGEIEWGGTVAIDNQDRVIAKDPSKSKFLLYDNDGRFLKEIYLPRNLDIEAPLPNDGYLISWQDIGPEVFTDHIGLCDSSFGNIKALGSRSVPNVTMGATKRMVGEDKLIQTASKRKIYVGYSKNGYEIGVYDLEGNMLRKIRKNYNRVRIDQDDKDKFLKQNQRNPDRDKYYFADYWPAFRYCFADDDDRLFVMTYEKGENAREAVYDVFSPQGMFIARTTLDNVGEYFILTVRAKKDRIYCLREDDEGYKELVVYKANWK
jgi:hypothetical protein